MAGFYHSIRIPNKPKADKPKRFDDYYNKELYNGDWNKRNGLFTEEETKIIRDHYGKLWWRYKDESELKSILNIALNVIIEYGIKYLEYIENNFNDFSKGNINIENINKKIFFWGMGVNFK